MAGRGKMLVAHYKYDSCTSAKDVCRRFLVSGYNNPCFNGYLTIPTSNSGLVKRDRTRRLRGTLRNMVKTKTTRLRQRPKD